MIRKESDMEVQVRENMRGGGGTVTVRHYFKKEEFKANTRLCSVLTVPPGAGIGEHSHEAEDEMFIITKGTGMLDDGETRTPVSAGDAILTGSGESHAIYNEGDEDLELIAIIMCYA